MNNLLCVVGPTAVGKTAKAIKLSLDQPSIMISADSRQVYRGMDIVTGKDHPKNINIYGIDILEPDEPCSVAVWYEKVNSHIVEAWEEKKLPIVVGGTGLYIKALIEGIETMKVPIDQNLRNVLAMFTIVELQEKLKELNNSRFLSMNNSDQNNPRRLIRAIEVSKSGILLSKPPVCISPTIVGIQPPDGEIYEMKIKNRVLDRIKNGAVEETANLLSKYGKNIQSMSALGYSSIIEYIEGLSTQSEMVDRWVASELAYAKRQMTWFRKQAVIWYDVGNIREYHYANTKN